MSDENPSPNESPILEPAPPPVDYLEKFTVNLTREARWGHIEPMVGRDQEVNRAVHVLCRKKKNNPLLIGEAGVGKTTIAQNLALRISRNQVPCQLQDREVYSIDIGTLTAGTRYRGDFEERVQGIIEKLKAKWRKPIVFIDEIHTMIKAGSASDSPLDMVSLLKPVITEGLISFMGSTTYQEYNNRILKDPALARRFQKIDILEPSADETLEILDGLKWTYEGFHNITYTKASLRSAVELSGRFLRDKKFPDKAIDVVDEAGVLVKLAGRTEVTPKDVETIISQMAQVPVKNLSRKESSRIHELEKNLKERVFGQDHAIDQIVSSVKMSRAGLTNPVKPIASFLLTGPTGVGKTEVARQLAELLGLTLIRLDMSEYTEKHTVSRLTGAPPGYVGHEDGGQLTDQVRNNPYSVVLLDEIEKAHPDIFNILLQIMGYGTLTDSRGKKTDFRNVILLMTSNLDSQVVEKRSCGFTGETTFQENDLEYKNMFRPEFRNRLDGRIHFNSLTPEVMGRIVDKFVQELEKQLSDRRVKIQLTESAREDLARRGYDRAFGARPLARLIQKELKMPLSEEILFGKLKRGGKVVVDCRGGELMLSYDKDMKEIPEEVLQEDSALN